MLVRIRTGVPYSTGELRLSAEDDTEGLSSPTEVQDLHGNSLGLELPRASPYRISISGSPPATQQFQHELVRRLEPA